MTEVSSTDLLDYELIKTFEQYLKNLSREKIFRKLRENDFDLESAAYEVVSDFCEKNNFNGSIDYAFEALYPIFYSNFDNKLQCIDQSMRYEVVLELSKTEEYLSSELLTIFNLLFYQKQSILITSKTILPRIIKKLRNPKNRYKKQIENYISFYVHELKQNLMELSTREKMKWIIDFLTIKLFLTYGFDLFRIKEQLMAIEGIPIVVSDNKIIGITSTRYLQRLFEYYYRTLKLKYNAVSLQQIEKIGDTYKLKDCKFGFSKKYFDPIKNVAEKFYFPSNTAPLIAKMRTALVLIAPTVEI